MSKINPVTQEIIEYEEMNHLYDNIHKYIYDQGYSILDKDNFGDFICFIKKIKAFKEPSIKEEMVINEEDLIIEDDAINEEDNN